MNKPLLALRAVLVCLALLFVADMLSPWYFERAARAAQTTAPFGNCSVSWHEGEGWLHRRAVAHVQAEYVMFELEDGSVVFATSYALHMDPPKTAQPQ